ncbi:GAP family protein [Saccharopolyspora sp. NFXS83]|uniref:GAP family protein n=1 Tax=Saccharopolyspora sp. NFXS83 TaxID=2993560 RepID=UPI00224AF8C0|nr:GAP family protein [Saccharopolyspora sp. NFXS83]MCX2728774.1 GAP family protein [Saccharopolyspora sp. NFXS83]
MGLQILPLAITMLAGPQIMSAIVFVTTARPVRVSVAFVLGVLVATTFGVLVASGLAALLGGAFPVDGESHAAGTLGKVVQIALMALLALLALRNWLRRKTAEPPKWLGALLAAGPGTALKTGLLVVLAMPSDIVIMLTVGVNLQHHDAGPVAAVPFIAATTLIAALPLLLYLLFHRRAVTAMPKLRDWMNTRSWLVNIIVCLFFIVLIATGG